MGRPSVPHRCPIAKPVFDTVNGDGTVWPQLGEREADENGADSILGRDQQCPEPIEAQRKVSNRRGRPEAAQVPRALCERMTVLGFWPVTNWKALTVCNVTP
jgi:hypothetical protein